MFKTKQEVEVFIDLVEGFINGSIDYRANQCSDTAATLNRRRGLLQEYIQDICKLGEQPQDPAQDYLCPDCGSAMKVRTNRQNGNKFYGCTKYPECKGTRDENGLSRAEREEQKYKKEVTHQEGFSFNRKRNPVTEVGPQ